MSEKMWAVALRRPNGEWFIDSGTVTYYRAWSIMRFNEEWRSDNYDAYRRMRRRGKARAVRVTVTVDPGQLEKE